MKKIIRSALLILFALAPALLFATKAPKLIVFYSPACHRCAEVKKEVLPEIQEEFKGKIEIEYKDIYLSDNYKYLLGLQEKYQSKVEISLPMIFFQGRFFNGKDDLEHLLRPWIAQALQQLPAGEEVKEIDLVERFKKFTPLAIVGAGLTDGINPCAFTVIVFFISFLALQGYRRRELVAIGLCFIFAVFLTYSLLGLGIFNFFYSLSGLWLAVKIINIGIGIFSIILGCIAAYDFYLYKKTGEPQEQLLQLPKAVKDRIHAVIGMHYRKTKDSEASIERRHIFRLIIAALSTGFLVSLLEAVCTGQLYVPTIAFILKTTHLKVPALGYLLLYNLMFVLPLLAIFFLALAGFTSQHFAAFLKKHLGWIKILMALVFFGLGLFLLWRG